MIEFIMLLAWALPTLIVWRRLGYVMWHNRGGICIDCKNEKTCSVEGCNRSEYNHPSRYSSSYSLYSIQHQFVRSDKYFCMSKFFVVSAAGILSVAWPLVILTYIGYIMEKKYGLDTSFLKPPPAIESKDEKMKRVSEERRVALEKAEAELTAVNKRLKELGIDVAR